MQQINPLLTDEEKANLKRLETTNGILTGITDPDKLIGSLVLLPDSITEIDMLAFADCTGLKRISIPNSVKVIGDSAFFNCTGLARIGIPNSITEIGKCAFSFCNSLTRVTIPAGVTIIDQEVFSACTSLTSVTIPHTVTVIGSAAFTCCFNLPAIVIAIFPFAFSTCRNLKTVIIESTVIKDIDETAFENVHADIHFTVKTDAVKAMLKKNTAIRDEQITVEPNANSL